MTNNLDKEIQAFEAMKPELMKHYFEKFVIFRDEKFIGAYDNFENAAEQALRKFGKGPYLIRQVTEQQLRMPSSVAYRVNRLCQ